MVPQSTVSIFTECEAIQSSALDRYSSGGCGGWVGIGVPPAQAVSKASKHIPVIEWTSRVFIRRASYSRNGGGASYIAMPRSTEPGTLALRQLGFAGGAAAS